MAQCQLILVKRIRPEKITEHTLIWDFLEPLDLGIDILHLTQFWGNSAMHAEIEVINNADDRQSVEEYHHFVIGLQVILLNALLSKCKVLSHAPALVVSSEESHLLWV